jgi:hypothetical protein
MVTPNLLLQTDAKYARLMPSVCAKHDTARARWKASGQVMADPKARKRARASAVRRGLEEQPNPTRMATNRNGIRGVGPPGTNGHVTAKSSIRRGVLDQSGV